ncbi:hypothetical protein Cgig2_033938 [Carnegiea gigantea]|uniref:Uncharacterized protein n=1 Tax=Carnegiea gigantea TaxID=171969 RepID=A0A9Q1GWJ2_9CARY|nr:hypothetical protein Cgig2_033938 [Carnegiea gigantea]
MEEAVLVAFSALTKTGTTIPKLKGTDPMIGPTFRPAPSLPPCRPQGRRWTLQTKGSTQRHLVPSAAFDGVDVPARTPRSNDLGASVCSLGLGCFCYPIGGKPWWAAVVDLCGVIAEPKKKAKLENCLKDKGISRAVIQPWLRSLRRDNSFLHASFKPTLHGPLQWRHPLTLAGISTWASATRKKEI